MKILEIVTIIAAVMAIFHKKARNVWIGLTMVLTVAITVQNGVRWTYYPLYIFVIVVSILINKPTKKYVNVILVILLIASFIPILIFPIYDIPKPTGKQFVGTKTYDVIDEARLEKYNDFAEKRKFRVQIYYPTDYIEDLEVANWLYDGIEVARGMSKDSYLPYFTFDHLANIKSNCYIEAPLSAKVEKYPVVIISHGWSSIRNMHQDFAEELASRGYIVVSIDHAYGAVATVFEDGKLASINYDALPAHSMNFLEKGNQLVGTYADDISRTIQFISELNNDGDDMFAGKLDEEKIGLLGHSTGGGAGVKKALKNDGEIKAIIGLDAWVKPIKEENLKSGINVPSLLLRSEQWERGNNNPPLELLVKSSEYKPLVYQIDETTHYDFSMVYMYTSVSKLLGYSGKIDSEHLTNMLKENIVSFFEQTLKKGEKPIIDLEKYDDMSEVEF